LSRGRAPVADYVLLGPVPQISQARDVAAAALWLGAEIIRVDADHIAARLPIEPLEGVNRWRWMAAALVHPELVATTHWVVAARCWAPSLRTGTVRLLTERRWLALKARS
jgi:hypothetical protein